MNAPEMKMIREEANGDRRSDPASFRMNNFDLIRLFAAIQVMTFHSIGVLGLSAPKVVLFFDIFPGVQIFFVLSGYLVTQSFERSRTIGDFARKRALRIYPGLWACVVVCAAVMLFFGFSMLRPEVVPWLVCQFVGFSYTPGFLRGFGIGAYDGSLWTIGIELQFYACVPILYAVLGRIERRTAALVGVFAVFCAVAVVVRVYSPGLSRLAADSLPEKLLQHSFVPYFHMFLAGALLRRLGAEESGMVRGRALQWIAGYVAVRFLVPDTPLTVVLGSVLLAVCAVSAAHTAARLSRRLIGTTDISYGTYLYHALVLNVLVECGAVGGWRDFSIAIVVSVVAGGLSWFLIERPCLGLKRRIGGPRVSGGDRRGGSGDRDGVAESIEGQMSTKPVEG